MLEKPPHSCFKALVNASASVSQIQPIPSLSSSCFTIIADDMSPAIRNTLYFGPSGSISASIAWSVLAFFTFKSNTLFSFLYSFKSSLLWLSKKS